MNKYKKIEFKDLLNIANTIKYLDELPINEICLGAKKFYGKDAKTIKINFADEYNDESYNFRVSEIQAFNFKNEEIILDYLDDDVEYSKKQDEYYSWKYSLEMGEESYDGNRELNDVIIDVEKQEVLNIDNKELPEIFIKE